MWVSTIFSVEGLNRTKGGRKSLPVFFLHHCPSWDISSHHLLSSDWIYTTGSPGSLDSEWIIPLVFLGLHHTDGKSWDSSASIIKWASFLFSVSLTPIHTLTHTLLFLFLWRTLIYPVWERFPLPSQQGVSLPQWGQLYLSQLDIPKSQPQKDSDHFHLLPPAHWGMKTLLWPQRKGLSTSAAVFEQDPDGNDHKIKTNKFL